ncbi:hypothetical protein VK682_26950 [Salipiger manganoxidans]|nr:hypothetical protein [Salipiger manganoxidans]MEB3422198.1 hypothetical protein [Salipiger manganoxidans]
MCWACVLGGDLGRLALAPQGVGYVGTMRMGLDRRPVALWQKAAQGPEAGAGAPLLDQPRVEFLGPDGARLPLNPHQWLADNGPCLPTAAGVLCLWHDRPPHAAAAAVPPCRWRCRCGFRSAGLLREPRLRLALAASRGSGSRAAASVAAPRAFGLVPR